MLYATCTFLARRSSSPFASCAVCCAYACVCFRRCGPESSSYHLQSRGGVFNS